MQGFADNKLDGRVLRLLEGSLLVWGAEGTVESVEGMVSEDTIWIARIVTASGTVVTVGRMTVAGGERQWCVARRAAGERDGEARGHHRPRMHGSISGLLRGVQRALDAPQPAGRLILTPRPMLG